MARERMLELSGFSTATVRLAIDTCTEVATSTEAQARDRVNASKVLLSLLPKSKLDTGPKRVEVSIQAPDWLVPKRQGVTGSAPAAIEAANAPPYKEAPTE